VRIAAARWGGGLEPSLASLRLGETAALPAAEPADSGLRL